MFAMECNYKKYKSLSLPQTVHSIEKIFIPTPSSILPHVTRTNAKKVFDIALIKLGRPCSATELINLNLIKL